jgi:hypothetical protein
MARAKKLSLQLDCVYSELEMVEKRDHLATVIVEIQAVEERKSSVARALKEELDGLYAESNKLAHQIKRRSETRLTECVVEYERPNAGEKQTIRLDTGELVKVELMTEDERQEEIEFDVDASRQVKGLVESINPAPPPTEKPESNDQPPEAA